MTVMMEEECPEERPEECPEELSFKVGKQNALEATLIRKEAIKKMFQKDKEGRKRRDSKFKEQAKMKRLARSVCTNDSDDDYEKKIDAQATTSSHSICKVKSEKTEKSEELRQKGYIKLCKHRLGPAERECIAKLLAEKQAKLALDVSRVPVNLSFKMHLMKKMSKRK